MEIQILKTLKQNCKMMQDIHKQGNSGIIKILLYSKRILHCQNFHKTLFHHAIYRSTSYLNPRGKFSALQKLIRLNIYFGIK